MVTTNDSTRKIVPNIQARAISILRMGSSPRGDVSRRRAYSGRSYFNPTIGPTVFFQVAEQPGFDLSHTSAQAGYDRSRTAFLTMSRSACVTGTLTRLNFLPVVHGSWPMFQLE